MGNFSGVMRPEEAKPFSVEEQATFQQGFMSSSPTLVSPIGVTARGGNVNHPVSVLSQRQGLESHRIQPPDVLNRPVVDAHHSEKTCLV